MNKQNDKKSQDNKVKFISLTQQQYEQIIKKQKQNKQKNEITD